MKTRAFLGLLLANALVVALGWHFFAQRGAAPIVPESELSPKERLRQAARSAAPRTSSLPPREVVVYRTNQFRWNQIESSDYRQYIANLRSVGCPESTIKDLILTDIMKLYAAQRGKFSDNGREFRYWETNEKRALNARQLADREKQLASIDKEIPSVLRELLGINYERELRRYFVDDREDEKRLAFLDEKKRDQILALRDQFEGVREKIMARAADGKLSPSDLEKLRAIDELRNGMLADMLSPQERAMFDLTASPTAERLRGELVGFNPNETEFRQIFERWRAFDEKFAYAGPEAEAAKETERLRIEGEIKATLSAERAADYDRTKNRSYQDLVLFSEQQELPPGTAANLMQMQQLAQEVRGKLLANADISPERREAALQELKREVERNLRITLPQSVYENYQRTFGNWLATLNKGGSSNTP